MSDRIFVPLILSVLTLTFLFVVLLFRFGKRIRYDSWYLVAWCPLFLLVTVALFASGCITWGILSEAAPWKWRHIWRRDIFGFLAIGSPVILFFTLFVALLWHFPRRRYWLGWSGGVLLPVFLAILFYGIFYFLVTEPLTVIVQDSAGRPLPQYVVQIQESKDRYSMMDHPEKKAIPPFGKSREITNQEGIASFRVFKGVKFSMHIERVEGHRPCKFDQAIITFLEEKRVARLELSLVSNLDSIDWPVNSKTAPLSTIPLVVLSPPLQRPLVLRIPMQDNGEKEMTADELEQDLRKNWKFAPR